VEKAELEAMSDPIGEGGALEGICAAADGISSNIVSCFGPHASSKVHLSLNMHLKLTHIHVR